MGEPTTDQRSPVCRLKYEADATRNFNWSKLDDIVGSAFTEGAALQIPADTITSDKLSPGTSVRQWSDASDPTSVPLLLGTERIVLSIHLTGLHDAPVLLTGFCLLTWENTAATAADASLLVTLRRRNSEARTHTATAKVPPTSMLPVYVPTALLHVPGSSDLGTTTANFDLVMTKLSGPDATLRIIPAEGRMQAIELA